MTVPPVSGRRRAGLALVLLTALGPVIPGAGLAAAVALVQSGPLAPYEEAAAAFSAAYPGPVSVFMLDGADPDRLRRSVLAARPEVVVAVGLKAALFARDHLPPIPLVFCVVPNYERFDLAGGSITGVSADVPPERDLAGLRLAQPTAKRVGLLFGRATGAELARRAHAAADAAGITLVEAPVSGLSELQQVARDLVGRVDARRPDRGDPGGVPDPARALPGAAQAPARLLGVARPLGGARGGLARLRLDGRAGRRGRAARAERGAGR
jgi:hypothetical protein